MTPHPLGSPADLLRRWVRATWLGWILGIPCVVALAVAVEALGIQSAQAPVGFGMGAAVGLLQRRALRSLLPQPGRWVWASVLGVGAPFLVSDLSGVVWIPIGYTLGVAALAGGLLAGVLQARLLRERLGGGWAWVGASGLGWWLATGAAGISDALFQRRLLVGWSGMVTYLGLVAGGGLVLGLVTGLCLGWMARRVGGAGPPG